MPYTTQELKNRWTPMLFFLMDMRPDYVDNSNVTPVKYFSDESVQAAEKSELFLRYMSLEWEEQQKLFQTAKDDELSVLVRACTHDIYVRYNKYAAICGYQYGINHRLFTWDDTSVEAIDRAVVNYIRHAFTNFDKVRSSFYGHYGKAKAEKIFKWRCLSRIAAMYHDFSDECQKQAKPLQAWCEKRGYRFDWDSGEACHV